jgi:hypothetical protein
MSSPSLHRSSIQTSRTQHEELGSNKSGHRAPVTSARINCWLSPNSYVNVRLKELIIDTLNSCNGLTTTTASSMGVAEGETIAVDVASADGADESGR